MITRVRKPCPGLAKLLRVAQQRRAANERYALRHGAKRELEASPSLSATKGRVRRLLLDQRRD
jgi:hypothetical protein